MQHQNQTHININLKVGKGAPSFLYRTLENALSRGISTFKVRIQNPEKGIYPNFCVPIAGIVRHFEEAHACTFLSSKSLDEKHYVGRTGILHPYEDPSSSKKNHFLDKIWLFNESNQYQIVEGIRLSLQQSTILSKGLLNCIELCLNEVMDNVLVHSCTGFDDSSPYGLAMAQVHPSGNRIAIAVYDNGIGMMNSLKNGGVAVRSPEEAITSGLQKASPMEEERETAFGSSMKSSKKAKALLKLRLAVCATLYGINVSLTNRAFLKAPFLRSHRLPTEPPW